MKFTLEKYTHAEAWSKRNALLGVVKPGSFLKLDNTREYEVLEVKENTHEGYESHFKITPINDCLNEYKREHDQHCKKNYKQEEIGIYPDFSFEVESLWFFSRNVEIINKED